MSLSTLRPAELAAATLAAVATLLVAIAPALLASPQPPGPAAGSRFANTAGIEWRLPPDGLLV
jgi:hypothetical protein